MRLTSKVLLLLGVSIIGTMSLTTSIELRSLEQKFTYENNQLHRTILANLMDNLSGALYNLDQSRIQRQLEASFQFGSLQRITVVDDTGKILAQSEQQRTPDGHVSIANTTESASELSTPLDAFKKPQRELQESAFDMISSPQANPLGYAITATLWYQEGTTKTFVGHVLMDYDDQQVKNSIADARKEKFIAMGAISCILFVLSFFFLEVAIIRRLGRLERYVTKVKNRDYTGELNVRGHDEISDLSEAFQAMVSEIRSYQTGLESKVEEQTRDIRKMLAQLSSSNSAIKAILDHVEFGLLRCDRKGLILPGYSLSSMALLGPTDKRDATLEGQSLAQALGLSGRDEDNFRTLYEQAVEDGLLADDLITQLPKRILKGDRYLGIQGAIITDSKGEPESVLFSIADITPLVAAERENENNQSLLRILRSRTRFIELLRQTLHSEVFRKHSPSDAETPPLEEILNARRHLHTWKGDFSVFGLSFFSSLLHQIEEKVDETSLLGAEIEKFQDEVRHYLESNAKILGIHPEDLDRSLVVLDDRYVRDFEEAIHKARDLREAKIEALRFIDTARSEEAQNLFEILLEGARDQAKRQGKDIQVKLYGGHVRLPLGYAEALTSLVHILRNSVDHGIEAPYLRKGKAPYGTIAIDVVELSDSFELTIADDGQGLDIDAIQRKAIAAGMLSLETWQGMSLDQRIQLIFQPGFSTKKEVSETSGRGIGLDAVASEIHKIGGTIRVISEPGKGTSFILSLPRIHIGLEDTHRAA